MAITFQTEAKLREEDLEVGRPWVHPRTHLEYADFHEFLKGTGPLSTWHNDIVEDLWKTSKHDRELIEAQKVCSFDEYVGRRAAYYRTYYNRDGYPFAAVNRDYQSDPPWSRSKFDHSSDAARRER